MYGLTGVCKVADITEESFLNYPTQDFYILSPIFSPEMTIKVPVSFLDQETRRIHSKEEVSQMIHKIPEIEVFWINDDRERNEYFRQMLKHGICSEWLTLIKTIYSYKYLSEFKGKRLNRNDDEIFKTAEKLLNQEFGFILNIDPNEIPDYIGQCMI